MTRPSKRQDLDELGLLANVSLFQLAQLIGNELTVEQCGELLSEASIEAETSNELLSNLEAFAQAHFALLPNELIQCHSLIFHRVWLGLLLP